VHEGDAPAVGRPDRQILVEAGIRGQRLELLRLDVEQHQVLAVAGGEIAFLVLLEVQRIDHDRLRNLGRGGPLGALGGFLAALLHHEHEPIAVGRPAVIADLFGTDRERPCVAAAAVEHHDLALVGAGRHGDVGQVAAVRTPMRRAGAVGRIGEREPLAAIPAHHPHGAARLVGVAVVVRDDVGNPGAVGRTFEIGDLRAAVEIVGAQRPARRRAGGGLPGAEGAGRRPRQQQGCCERRNSLADRLAEGVPESLHHSN